MKHAKKLASLLLALVMVLSMSVPTFAADEPENPNKITVNNAKPGETYSAYQMLELVVNDPANPTAYEYTVNDAWADFFADGNKEVWGTVLQKDDQGHFTAQDGITSETTWVAGSKLSTFAEKANEYASGNALTPVVTATCQKDEDKVELITRVPGYYLVTSTLGTRAMIDTTPGAVTMNEKNEEDTIEKKVKEDSSGVYGASNDAQVGDTVEFKSTVTIVPRSVNVKIHDTMDSGLTLDESSIKVYTDENLSAEYASAAVHTGNSADKGDTFTIVIPDSFAETANENQKLYVVYTAELNANAVVKDENGVVIIVDQKNKTKVAFGDSTTSTEATTTTTTHKFTVHKYPTGDTNTNLADAIFQLKKNGTVVNLVKLDDNNYRVVGETGTTTPTSHVKENQEVNEIEAGTIVSDFVTVASGDIVIWGVDADADYTIEEIQTPKGYNKINPSSVNVTVSVDNSLKVDVENKTGAELPSTGGMGTTIFYVIGSILLVGAAVLLITRKRMNGTK